MQVQVNTDHHINHSIKGREALADKITHAVEMALSRVSDRITRVQVHLSDENSDKKGGNDLRCVMEARLDWRQPVAVTHQAGVVDQAVVGAAGKLRRLIDRTLSRMRDQRRRNA